MPEQNEIIYLDDYIVKNFDNIIDHDKDFIYTMHIQFIFEQFLYACMSYISNDMYNKYNGLDIVRIHIKIDDAGIEKIMKNLLDFISKCKEEEEKFKHMFPKKAYGSVTYAYDSMIKIYNSILEKGEEGEEFFIYFKNFIKSKFKSNNHRYVKKDAFKISDKHNYSILIRHNDNNIFITYKLLKSVKHIFKIKPDDIDLYFIYEIEVEFLSKNSLYDENTNFEIKCGLWCYWLLNGTKHKFKKILDIKERKFKSVRKNANQHIFFNEKEVIDKIIKNIIGENNG